ncbi:type VI secretion system lysozyme-like protein [Yersinia frederiksenii]|uniref:type VI secretion system baseplate subunit TssE n=1 Tax=Yersinia frederiksenii TaxID=29484 RepID=UPI0005DB7F0C|nr:type VI secretion system lysozyme-like protein [Yersinia frederiksenii]
MSQPSLYEMLFGNVAGGLDLDQVNETHQGILSVVDNMQRILNCRAGTLSHLPDYGLPDMSKVLQGMPGTAHSLLTTLSNTLLKYEPRLKSLNVVLLPQSSPGHLEYGIDAELKEYGLVHFGTVFMPEGRVLIRHLKQQNYLNPDEPF